MNEQHTTPLSAEAKRQRARDDAERFQLGVQAAVRRGSWQMVRVTLWFCAILIVGTVVLMTIGSIAHWW